MKLGDRIKTRREEIGMTQEELATKLGYKGKSSISKIEKGETDLNQSKIKQMSEALGVSIGYLMGWEGKDTLEAQLGSNYDVIFSVSKDLSEENIQRLLEYAKLLILSQKKGDEQNS